MGLRRTVDATTEPVTLAEMKSHLKVDFSEDDDLISALIGTAREFCEDFQDRAYIEQTWVNTLDGFPGAMFNLNPDPASQRIYALQRPGFSETRWQGAKPIVLARAPLISVTSIQYIDTDGATQTLDPAKYTVDTQSEPGRIFPAWNEVWPATRAALNTVTITYKAGYGANASTTPRTVKACIKFAVAAWYDNRQGSDGQKTDGSLSLPKWVEALLWPQRLVSFA